MPLRGYSGFQRAIRPKRSIEGTIGSGATRGCYFRKPIPGTDSSRSEMVFPVRAKQKRRSKSTGATNHERLCSFRPARQVLFLLRREAVDLDAHRFEFQLGDFL